MFSQAKIAELKKVADQAFTVYDRASRHMGNNEEECSRLYFEQQRATDAWQAAVKSNNKIIFGY